MRTAIVLLFAAVASGAADDTVVARVNGTPITEMMVRVVVRGLIKGQGTPPTSEEIAKLNDQALESLIELELLHQDAQARGLTVSDDEVSAEIQRTRARFSDQKQYDAALAQSGLSAATLRADTRKTLVVNRLLTEVVWKDIRVTPEEAQRFYADNSKAFVRGGKQLSFAEADPSIQRLLRDVEQRKREKAFLAGLTKTARVERPTPLY